MSFFFYSTLDFPDDGEYTEEFDEKEYIPLNPCNGLRIGDPDLPTYDILSSYRFDEQRFADQGVKKIIGSSSVQTAYHFESYSNLTIESSRAFPKGVPPEFSFEATFRIPEIQPLNEWYLFELTDYLYESQMSVIINPINYAIDFSIPLMDGTIQTVSFEEVEVRQYVKPAM